MFLIHQTAVYLHITGGIVALLLFWIPVFAHKGSPIHKRIGRYFALLMYMIGISGLLMSSMDLWMPDTFHPDRSAAATRNTAVFLFSLSLLVLTTTRHGWLTINYRDDRLPLRRPLQLFLVGTLLLSGIVLFGLGLTRADTVYIAFGSLEVAVSAGMLRYTFKQHTHPREWWIEHLSGLFASGIGAYTAFFVFGAFTILEPAFIVLPWLPVLVWVGPGVIGGIAIAVVSRHYRRKFASKTVASTT